MTTVLNIEDNDNNIGLVCVVLKQSGYKTCFTAACLAGAQQTISNPPNFAILDIQLAYAKGLKILRNNGLHPIGKQIPIIAMALFAMQKVKGN